MNIVVFQERGSGKLKTAGLKQYGNAIEIVDVISIDDFLPDFIEEPEEYINHSLSCDLVLNYLNHPDLVEYLIQKCENQKIPVVSPGKKGGGFTPFTCCGLGKNKKLGTYGDIFGLPEYEVQLKHNIIQEIRVKRGAPCGATWNGLQNYIGSPVEDLLTRLPRQVQYFCSADPSGFDPVSGKSPVHYAGYVHIAALQKAIEKAGYVKK